jgi:hypothetical protein
MNCWHCKTELIWGGDDDCDEEMEFALAFHGHQPKLPNLRKLCSGILSTGRY